MFNKNKKIFILTANISMVRSTILNINPLCKKKKKKKKNDTLSADTFDDVVTFNNCLPSSCSHYFLLKNSKGLSFNAGCLVSMWQSSFEDFMASLDSQSSHIIQSGLGECESPVAMNP